MRDRSAPWTVLLPCTLLCVAPAVGCVDDDAHPAGGLDATVDARRNETDAGTETGAIDASEAATADLDAALPDDAAHTEADAALPADAGMDATSTMDATPAADAAPTIDAASPIDAASADAADPSLVRASEWSAGSVDEAALPPRAELKALPGGGEGPPVLVSNNPELFEGDGLLYGNARPSPERGGAGHPLSGDFGVYLHHLNGSGATRWVFLLVTNPGSAAVTLEARGSGYSQTETGGLGLGTSPDYRVSDEWVRDAPTTIVPPTAIEPLRPLVVWRKRVNAGAEIDGRFALRASSAVFVYVVATSADDVNEAVRLSRLDAPGDYRVSGTPPPPFGREAGVYAHDTWRADFRVEVPAGPRRLGFVVNTATGAGFAQVQAFPALDHYDASAAESVGMYGNVYDLTVTLIPDGADSLRRRVRVLFASLATGTASRYWDGVALVDGVARDVRHVPGASATVLAEASLAPGERRTVSFRAMVPGLTSIPQALYVESE